MKHRLLILLALIFTATLTCGAQEVDFDRYFDGGTLRIDCLREGSALGDTVWVSRWVDRQNVWHGSRTQLLDPFDNGDYRVEMRDAESGKVIYSRGYSNLFREYKDTPDGRTKRALFEETLLVPMPKKAVRIALQKRDGDLKLKDATVVDFDATRQRPERIHLQGERHDLELNGNPANKMDVVIVAQGYDGEDEAKLRHDFSRMKEVLFGKEPFASRREDFNVYGVIGDAGAKYGVFGADRYLMTFQVHKLHDIIGSTPCDHIIIMVNDEKYGGGAIYNFYAVSSLDKMAEYIMPHELGHSIGGLADEYVDEELSYSSLHKEGPEPLEPNITNLVDFGSKWRDLLAEGTAIPTPFDAKSPREECGPLGVYEGAGYSSKGVYRPVMHCMMRDYAPFCPVCSRRLTEVFNLYTK